MDSSILLILLGLMAFLYASVGHGGASGYLAVMAIFAIAPKEMKQTALMLNLGVSLLAFNQFYQKRHFRFGLFWPFALSSVPMSYVGAQFVLSDANYKRVLGVCLFIAIIRMLVNFKSDKQCPISIFGALIIGALIGMLSGMIGIGGGIILSPVLLLLRWANLKEAAAVSALFIFVNSVAGLLGNKQWVPIDQNMIFMVSVALLGGMLGARWGAQFASIKAIRLVLVLVLLIASGKLLFV